MNPNLSTYPLLRLELFTTAFDDLEKRQYEILASLHSHRYLLAHSRLYPALADAIDIRDTLLRLIENKSALEDSAPKQLTSIDWKNKKLVYEPIQQSNDLDAMFLLIEWALPKIHSIVDEGMAVYDFVDQNIVIDAVGIMPIYTDAGYVFVPEHRTHTLHVLRYELSVLTSSDGTFRAMKTNEIDQVEEQRFLASPEDLKLRLIKQYRELPNPATYLCETDLDFSYSDTILPVVKRKFMIGLAA